MTRRRIRLVVSALLAALTGAVLGGWAMMSAQPGPLRMRPRWTAGESWQVEYARRVPSTTMSASAEPPEPERTVWEYRVLARDKDDAGPFRLSVRTASEPTQYEVELDPSDLTVLRVLEISGPKRHVLIEGKAHRPLAEWSQSRPVLFDWPLLPEVAKDARRTALLEDGDELTETFRSSRAEVLETTLTRKRVVDQGFVERTVTRQTWEAGRPWWTTASVELEQEIDGKTSRVGMIEGKLLR